MKCRYCGSEIDNNAKFCTECGREVTTDSLKTSLYEYRRLRNKLYLFDDKSNFLNIYCKIMLAIFAIIFIVSLILKIEFIPIFAGIFMGIILLMLWANNREYKRVRIAVGRPLVIILPILMIQIILVSIFMYSTKAFDDSFFNTDVSVESSYEDGI